MASIDPITISVIGNYLSAVAEEMGAITMKTARSNLIKEGGDFSTALFDARGRLMQHGRDMPAHLGLFPILVRQLLTKVDASTLAPGDAFMTNADDVGGSHLNDVKVAAPIFYDGRVVMWAANLAHWPDVGGAVPGSYYGQATEIFQEGLQIPLVQVARRGELIRDVTELVLKNVRGSRERLGDLRSQLASIQFAARRLEDLFRKYGTDTVLACFDALVDHADARVREEIAKIPPGRYEFTDYMDDDGHAPNPVKFHVCVEVSPDSITFDFTGTDPEAVGPINSPYGQTCSAAYYAFRAVTDFTIPANDGAYRRIQVVAPPGTVVNCGPYRPRVYCTHETSTRLVDVCLGALAQALPGRVPAAGYGSSYIMIVGGVDPRTGRHYAWYEPVPGGFGARPGLDGIDGTRVHMGNTANTPVEVFERDYPLICEQYEFIPDSCGAGRWRGGLGVTKRIRPRDLPDNRPVCSSVSDRNRFAPYGLAGGKPSVPGRWRINAGTPAERAMPGPCPGKTSYRLAYPETWAAFTPGGGGYGDPLERDPKRVLADVIEEKVSVAAARREYGVVVDPVARTVDWEATAALRERMRNEG